MDTNEDDLVGQPPEDVPKRDPTDEDCMAKRTDDGTFVGYCRAWPGRGTDHVGEGRCKNHGGLNSGANGQGAKEGNDNAATHYAYAEIATKSLTEGEQAAFDEIEADLEDPTSAKGVARKAAAHCLLMGHRSGDERWFRRYESICDKFSIAPDEVERHEHTGEGGGAIEVNIKRERYDG